MKPLRIVFMGTPDFSVSALEALIHSEHTIVGVFTQPDKQSGRGNKINFPPVKTTALEYHLPVFQPESLRTEECKALFEELKPDLMIVIAYGKILPAWLLAMPTYGCINIHASILPSYRGASPIHWSILNGDEETGVTFMQMDEGMDTGDILHIERTVVLPEETTGELFERLALLGSSKLLEVIEGRVKGELLPVPQEHAKASYTKKIEKALGYVKWEESALTISRLIRGLSPTPGAVTLFDNKRLKLWRGKALKGSCKEVPGTIVAVQQDSFSVATGEGILEIYEVQPENKKRMAAGDFIRGHKLTIGQQFNEFNIN